MDEIKTNKQLGMKWFTFYTKIRPWLACFMALSVIVDFLRYPDVYLSYWWTLLYFLAAVAQPILSVIVLFKSSGDYGDFVRFVKGVLLFEIINMSYQQGVQHYINSNLEIGTAVVFFVVTFVISYFLWYRLNAKYFEKRIGTIAGDYLEENSNRITQCLSCGYQDKNYFDACPKCGKYKKQYVYLNEEATPEKDAIRFCRKCGAPLTEDSNFCEKCGTQIVKE